MLKFQYLLYDKIRVSSYKNILKTSCSIWESLGGVHTIIVSGLEVFYRGNKSITVPEMG